MSRITLNLRSLPAGKGNHLAAFSRILDLVSNDGLGFQSWSCLVPPMIVPPPSGRGTQNDQVPSAIWRVRVTGHGLSTRQV
jgi:hypothetical protein